MEKISWFFTLVPLLVVLFELFSLWYYFRGDSAYIPVVPISGILGAYIARVGYIATAINLGLLSGICAKAASLTFVYPFVILGTLFVIRTLEDVKRLPNRDRVNKEDLAIAMFVFFTTLLDGALLVGFLPMWTRVGLMLIMLTKKVLAMTTLFISATMDSCAKRQNFVGCFCRRLFFSLLP